MVVTYPLIVTLIILSSVGGLIGWVTNVLAIKLIFRPLNPVKIPMVNFTIQGLIPKRRHEIAKNIAQTVERDLVSMDQLIEQVISERNKQEMLMTIKYKVSSIIEQKIPTLVPYPIRRGIIGYITDIIDEEGKGFIKDVASSLAEGAKGSVSIAHMIEEKINSLELENLERMILNIADKELKHIEVLGAVLGAVIGLVQGLMLRLLNI